jgi:hypothetical protein
MMNKKELAIYKAIKIASRLKIEMEFVHVIDILTILVDHRQAGRLQAILTKKKVKFKRGQNKQSNQTRFHINV